jgi:hypothetical protein
VTLSRNEATLAAQDDGDLLAAALDGYAPHAVLLAGGAFEVTSLCDPLEVTAVGKDVRRLPYGPDRDMQRISDLFGSNSGATCQWVDFSKNLGRY